MRILFIGDECGKLGGLDFLLSSAGFDVRTACVGADGRCRAILDGCDLICLNSSLSEMQCRTVLGQMHPATVRCPVLVLADARDWDAKVGLLATGGDDIVATDYRDEEILARIQNLVRRSKGQSSSVMIFGKLAVDTVERTARVSGQVIYLTDKEFRTLEILALHKSSVVTKAMLAASLYPGSKRPESATIETFVWSLRRKLSMACDGEDYILTDHQSGGYLLCSPRPDALPE